MTHIIGYEVLKHEFDEELEDGWFVRFACQDTPGDLVTWHELVGEDYILDYDTRTQAIEAAEEFMWEHANSSALDILT